MMCVVFREQVQSEKERRYCAAVKRIEASADSYFVSVFYAISMNGAPGGSRQSEKLPIQPPTTTAPATEVGTIRPATLRALQSTAAAIFPQQEEAGPSSQVC